MKKIISLLLTASVVFAASVLITDKSISGFEMPVYENGNGSEIIRSMENDIDAAIEIAGTAATNTDAGKISSALGYVIVTDRISANGKNDVSDEIQAIIDSNPNRTIYFPDGIYLLSKPLRTPANPSKSVDLQLSNYAVIRAAENWSGDSLIHLGGKDAANDTHTAGSNYSLTGGVLDGSGLANGISIDSGRETAVRNVSVKNTPVGIKVNYGANSGSSDADISDVNIIGTGTTDSVGIYVEGYDNTFTNVRIGNVFTGVHLKSSANSLRNIHPLYYSDYTDYENSCGFLDEGGNNIYDFCYSDQFCIGFRTVNGVSSIFDNCFCFWYSEAGGREIAFKADGKFNSVVTNFRGGFRGDTVNSVLVADENGGSGVFDNLLVYSNDVSDRNHKKYTEGSFFMILKNLFA